MLPCVRYLSSSVGHIQLTDSESKLPLVFKRIWQRWRHSQEKSMMAVSSKQRPAMSTSAIVLSRAGCARTSVASAQACTASSPCIAYVCNRRLVSQ